VKYIFLSLAVCSFSAFSSNELITTGSVISIENTSQNTNQFVVWVEGSGACNGVPIRFKEENSQSVESFNRAFSMLLMAQTAGYKVKISGSTESDCNNATWVKVTK